MRKITREIRGETMTESKKERLHEIQRGIRNWRRRWGKRKRVEKGENEEMILTRKEEDICLREMKREGER